MPYLRIDDKWVEVPEGIEPVEGELIYELPEDEESTSLDEALLLGLLLWAWDSEAARYALVSEGASIATLGYAGLDTYSLGAIQASSAATDFLAAFVSDGTLPADQWLALMREEIKEEAIRQMALGRGGIAALTEADYKALGEMLKEQYAYLDKFYQEILDGKLSEAQIAARAKMYINSAREAFEAAKEEAARAAGFDEEAWLVNPALENCFPAGTQIATPTGERSIEKLGIGDIVCTLLGDKRIARIYHREYHGCFVIIRKEDCVVSCTPNHPFLTQRGEWCAAEQLSDNEAVLYKNVAHNRLRHLAFPYSDDGITACRKISVLGHIAFSLFDLPFLKRLKTRMPMPPIAIGLDNQIINFGINNKLGLNEIMGLIDNPERIKNRKQLNLKFGRPIFLNLTMSLHQCLKVFWMFLKAALCVLSKIFGCSRSFRWIIGTHPLTCHIIYKPTTGFIINDEADCISLTLNLPSCFRDIFANFIRSHVGKVLDEKINLFLGPYRKLAIDFPNRLTLCAIGIDGRAMKISDLATSRAGDPLFPGFVPGNICIPTFDRTKHRNLGSRKERFSTENANTWSLFPHDSIPPPTLLSTKPRICQIYNLEIEDAHHYVANGFVVHNCDDCLAFQAEGWKPIGYFPRPAAGATRCLSNCGCGKAYRKSQI